MNKDGMRPSRLLAVPAAAALAAVATPFASAATVTITLPTDVPALASAASVGTVNTGETMTFVVQLAGPDEAQLATVAQDVSDPSSPEYRQFLTKAQAEADFAPSAAASQTVITGLEALGFSVTQVSTGGGILVVQGTVAQVTAGLGVQFKMVDAPGVGDVRVATTNPVLPTALAPLVTNVVGLTETPAQPFVVEPNAYFIPGAPVEGSYYGQYTTAQGPTALPTYDGQAQDFAEQGYTPQQIRAAYQADKTGEDGTGVSIGVVDAQDSPTMLADANQYFAENSFPGFAAGQYNDESNATVMAQNDEPELPTTVDGINDIPDIWYEEQSLDVEMEHTMAPGADVYYYGAEAGVGTIAPLGAELGMAMTADQVQFVSDSYGIEEGSPLFTPADKELFDTDLELGATEGIGASFSSGDDADYVQADSERDVAFPAADDMGTAVGGTSLAVGANDQYEGETYWGAYLATLSANGQSWGSFAYSSGGGGGVSFVYAEPSWQDAVVPTSLTTYSGTSGSTTGTGTGVTTPGRVVPDISLVGNPATGVEIGETFTLASGATQFENSRIGGTSVSSPLFAGVMAQVIESAHQAGAVKAGTGLGFISPTLYAAYQKSPDAFRDPDHNPATDDPTLVRTDYTNTQDPTTGYTYSLRELGNLGTLHALAGYDDSTGLGTPCMTEFVPAVVTPTVTAAAEPGCNGSGAFLAGTSTPTSALPESPWAVAVPVAGLGLLGAALRRRHLSASRRRSDGAPE